VRAFGAQPFGADPWRAEKGAFLQFCRDAVAPEPSPHKSQFVGFVGQAFGDVDTDKDGKINAEQFDRLMEKVAALPRRFGLAPQSTETYSTRLSKHTAIFDALDKKDGSARGFLALDQVVAFAQDHVAGKVSQVPGGDVEMANYAKYSEKEYLDFMERALLKPDSYERSTFYNFCLTSFIAADVGCNGKISFDQFDVLVDKVAAVPRHFGLAPLESSDTGARRKLFESMELHRDGKGTGFVTHRKFWEWTLMHTTAKLELQKAGKGWRENH